MSIKIIRQKKKSKVKKCEECPFLLKVTILDQEIKKAIELQQEYLDLVKKVNETLAKYNKKIDELEEGNK